MSSKTVRTGIANSLRDMNLDYDGLIEKAAELLADLSARLDECEQQLDYYQKAADEGWAGVRTLLAACEALSCAHEQLPAQLDNLVEITLQTQRRIQAHDNSVKKLSNDPKQKAKSEVHIRWKLWHLESPHSYNTNDEFATATLAAFSGQLDNHTQITQWCGEWGKASVKHYWENWKKSPASYATEEEFATAVLKIIKTLKRHDIIRWCKKWSAI